MMLEVEATYQKLYVAHQHKCLNNECLLVTVSVYISDGEYTLVTVSIH